MATKTNRPAGHPPDPDGGGRGGDGRVWRDTSLGRIVTRFLDTEAASGLVLMAAAAIGLLWANSPWQRGYHDFVGATLRLDLGARVVRATVHAGVNDGLMAVFFLVAGLEVKREITAGELCTPRRAALPVMAAVGGMVVPVAIYVAFNRGDPGGNGWALPMATDVAFALGVLALLGPRVPPTLKVFLLALAVVDDIGAILVIAVFYTEQVRWAPLGVAAALVAVVVLMGRLRVSQLWPYVLAGLGMWVAVQESGVHPTVAGVALAFAVPGRLIGDRLEDGFHPLTAFLIVPLFGLVNAGVTVGGDSTTGPGTRGVVIGVFTGLVVGKLVGVAAATWVAVKLQLGHLPDGVAWRHVVGLAALSGIGFTVALLLADLAFDAPPLEAAAKSGILLASLGAALLGAAILVWSGPAAVAGIGDEGNPAAHGSEAGEGR